MYPPFCVHFYPEHYYDFPICSPNFDTLDEALAYAANHHLECKLFRIGFWSGKKYPDRYFCMEEFDVQRSLF